jgi:GLPGLI family protein
MSYKLLAIILIVSFNTVEAQDFLVEYDKIDLKNLESDSPFDRYTYELTIDVSESKSRFKAKDTIIKGYSEANDSRNTYKLGGKHTYFYDIKKSEIIQVSGYGNGDPNEIGDADTAPWIITNESKKISGYQCFLATKDMSYRSGQKKISSTAYAWFTPEINFFTGPYFAVNLPGLVLFYNLNNSIGYMATKVKKINEVEEWVIPDNPTITAQEAREKMNRIFAKYNKRN